jgi:NTE family protein
LNSNTSATDIPDIERALVLQGGGSLGAYEAGAYKALYEWLSERDAKVWKEKKSTFDIVAGTSIGAMNAAVLVSYVVDKGTYDGSAERLEDFWNYLSKESTIETNPFFKSWWDYWHRVNRSVATGEAARRYYSAKEFAITGVPNVFSPLLPMPDSRFFDSYNNTWFRFSNEPLKRSLERFAKFPIATNHEKNQPRLILVAVDVAAGRPVVFDSYPKQDGSRKTEYGRYITQNNKEIGFEYIIRYDNGITADHVMASGSYPVNFDYASLEVESYDSDVGDDSEYQLGVRKKSTYTSSNGSTNNKSDLKNPLNRYKKETRKFWDGGLMSNTPLSQLVILHRQYWYLVRGLKDKVPTLRVCIFNVHPTKQKQIPTDHDGVVNRNADITFSDRTYKDQEILLLISDYVDLVRDLIEAAKENKVKDQVINDLLDKKTRYHGKEWKPRRYRDILEGRFDVDTIVRIERKTDENTIADKTFDFSDGTIRQLLKDGYEESINYLPFLELDSAPQATKQVSYEKKENL